VPFRCSGARFLLQKLARMPFFPGKNAGGLSYNSRIGSESL